MSEHDFEGGLRAVLDVYFNEKHRGKLATVMQAFERFKQYSDKEQGLSVSSIDSKRQQSLSLISVSTLLMILMKMASICEQAPVPLLTGVTIPDEETIEIESLTKDQPATKRKVFVRGTINYPIGLGLSVVNSADKAFIKDFVLLQSSLLSADCFWKLDELLILSEGYPFQRPPSGGPDSFCSAFEEDTVELVVSYVENFLPQGSCYRDFGSKVSTRPQPHRKKKGSAGRGIGGKSGGRDALPRSKIKTRQQQQEEEEEVEEEDASPTSPPAEKKYLSDSEESLYRAVPAVSVATRSGRKSQVPVRWAEITHTYVAETAEEVAAEVESDLEAVLSNDDYRGGIGEVESLLDSSQEEEEMMMDMTTDSTVTDKDADSVQSVMNMIWPMSQETDSEEERMEIQVSSSEEAEVEVGEGGMKLARLVRRGSKHRPPDIPHLSHVIDVSQDTERDVSETETETETESSGQDIFKLASKFVLRRGHVAATHVEEDESESIGEYDTDDTEGGIEFSGGDKGSEGNMVESICDSLDLAEVDTSETESDMEFLPLLRENVPWWWSPPAPRG